MPHLAVPHSGRLRREASKPLGRVQRIGNLWDAMFQEERNVISACSLAKYIPLVLRTVSKYK